MVPPENNDENNEGKVNAGTTNPGVIWTPDNPLKGTGIQYPGKPDNPVKGIWNLVPHGIWIQWPRGLTVPT